QGRRNRGLESQRMFRLEQVPVEHRFQTARPVPVAAVAGQENGNRDTLCLVRDIRRQDQFEASGSNPPQKPQPIREDFLYLGSKRRWEHSRVTSCHFFSTTSRLRIFREGPPGFSKKNWRYFAGTSAR